MQDYIKKLSNELLSYNEAYYKGKPIVTDEVFDLKLEELKQLELKYTEYKLSNSPTSNVGKDKDGVYKHIESMLSLRNVYTSRNANNEVDLSNVVKEVEKFSDVLSYSPDLVIEHKYDGMSIELVYEDNKLSKALTRGDGVYGNDVTNNVLNVNNVISIISNRNIVSIRGELVIFKEDFKVLNKDNKYSNPRNAVAGLINSKDLDESIKKHITFIPYSIISTRYEDYADLLLDIEKDGFNIYNDNRYITKDLNKISDIINNKDNLDYDIDGVVVKLNKVTERDKFSSTSKYPLHSFAVKLPATFVTTVVLDIIEQISASGKYTPVAILEPVNLQGSKISKVTLHNYKNIEKLDVRINDVVTIYKAGDIIPAIHHVNLEYRVIDLPKYKPLSKCEYCDHDLKITELNNICTNTECKGIVSEYLTLAVSKDALDIKGLSSAIVNRLVMSSKLKDIDDIYKLTKEDLIHTRIEGKMISDKVADNLLTSISKSLNTELYRVLKALNIPGLGKSACKELATKISSIKDLLTTDNLKVVKWLSDDKVKLVNSLSEINFNFK